MARGRLISRGLGSSRKFYALASVAGELGEFAQVLFPLLVTHTDDFGRQAGDAFTVKHVCFPVSPRPEEDFERALRAMHEVGLITLYDTTSGICLQVSQFDEHQPNLHKRTTSKFPEPSTTSKSELSTTSKSPEACTTSKPDLSTTSKSADPCTTASKSANLSTTRHFREYPGHSRLRARAELNLRELNLSTKDKSSAAGASREPQPVENAKANMGVITKIAHEVLEQLGVTSPELAESVKSLCATRHIRYTSGVVQGAIESAIVQRKRARA